MSAAEKLEALLQKAIDGGWSPQTKQDGREIRIDPRFINWETTLPDHAYWFIFNHDFARALFPGMITFPKGQVDTVDGERLIEYGGGMLAFEHHLQQAIVLPTASEQIDYFYKAVFGE